jgi:acyl-CoA synthetase (AMP-forming)/AMP-acid ligase II
MLLDPSLSDAGHSKSMTICSDPSVVVSSNASRRNKELWWLHGHPHSKRYSDPKLVSLAALVRHDGLVYKGQKAFLYPVSAGSSTPYGTMTWDQFDQVTESLAFAYSRQLQDELDEANITQKQPTIALLGEGTTLLYFCTQLALQKLGVRVLLLAESNAKSALHHLLETCSALAVITDRKNARANTNGVRKLDMIEEFPKVLQTPSAEVDAVRFQDFGDIWERHTFIIHSSGSTGMPKPIIHTNRSMMLIARMYRLFPSFEVENWFLLFPLWVLPCRSIISNH